MKRKFYFFLTVSILLPYLVLAGTQGKIRGKVVDSQTGEALVGASIVVVGTQSGATTDVNGEYNILKLEVGTYSLRASYIGYQTITLANIRVNADLTSDADFKLPAEGVQVSTVVVVAERPLVNKSATASVRILDNEAIVNMPVRGVESVVRLQPGVVERNGSFYVRGARPDATGFVVDNVPITNKFTGMRGVQFNSESVEQIQVQAGGYSAEYGNATGGLVISQLRTGSDKWKFTVLGETDNFTGQNKKSLGTFSYGYSDYTVTAGGPILSDKLRFFGSFQNTFLRDPDLRFWDGINIKGLVTDPTNSAKHPDAVTDGDGDGVADDVYPDTLNLLYPSGNRIGGLSSSFNYVGTLLYSMGDIQFRASGSYQTREQRDPARMRDIFNTSRTPYRTFENGFGSFKITHFITPTVNYEANVYYTTRTNKVMDPVLKENFNSYGDSIANKKAGFQYWKRYADFETWGIYGGDIDIDQPGTWITNYDVQNEDKMGGRLDFSMQYEKSAIKVGGEYNQYEIRRFNPGNTFLRAQTMNDGSLSKDKKEVQLRNQGGGIDNYGYDVYGNKIDGDIVKKGNITDLGARQPVEAALYVQNKIELPDINLNIGLRYDYIANDGLELIKGSSLNFDDSNKVLAKSSWKITDAAQYLSPRIGFSFPVTDRTVFYAQYNKLVSTTRFRDSYLGLGRTYIQVKGGNYFDGTLVSGWGLRPERTSQYEIGFTQQLSEVSSFELTTFYRDIQDQIQYAQIQPDPGASQQVYPTLVNGDYSTTKGVEFRLTLRRTHRVQAQVSYTYSDARGTGSNANSLAGAVAASGQPGFIPKFVFPVDFNQTHSGNVSVDYRFEKGDGGAILQQLGANLLLSFNSGYSFTRLNIEDLSLTDARGRIPVEQIGASTTPWNFQLDLRVDKTVELGPIDMNIYVRVINLLNAENPTGVFARTGSAKDDGWLATAKGSSQVNLYGQQYADAYKGANLGYNANNFSQPRQIRFGIKLEY